jgi:hypothetical protein
MLRKGQSAAFAYSPAETSMTQRKIVFLPAL